VFAASQAKPFGILVVVDKLSAAEPILVVALPSAVWPTLATDSLLFAVIRLIGQTVVPPGQDH
jgi:hypothetical protein